MQLQRAIAEKEVEEEMNIEDEVLSELQDLERKIEQERVEKERAQVEAEQAQAQAEQERVKKEQAQAEAEHAQARVLDFGQTCPISSPSNSAAEIPPLAICSFNISKISFNFGGLSKTV